MAANRKLQAEIDRCLKKVSEGVEKFEENWQKVHNASNANQKEKYEEDLKKEIKKLQRLRDQIKTWIASGAINDKTVLMEKRKLIEQLMERFKIVERETKTKAYSKEGLTWGTKLDPAEKERYETSKWLNDQLDTLNLQIDQFEAEIETLGTGKKKKSRDNSDQIDEYQSLLEKHRDHVQKLEMLLRMLDNDNVNIDQIKDIKDDVEYYIENCREPDFMENDMVYDDIDGLEEMLAENFRDKHPSVQQQGSSSSHDHNNANSVDNSSETMSTNSANSPVPQLQHNSSNHHSNNRDSASSSTANATTNEESDSKRRHKSSSDDGKSGSTKSSSVPQSSSLTSSKPHTTTAPTNNSSASMISPMASTSASSATTAAAVVAASAGSSLQHFSSSSSTQQQPGGKTVPGQQQQQPASASSKFSTSTPNNSSPSSGAAVVTNHVGGSTNSSSASQSPAILPATSQPNFAEAVQLNGHGLSDLVGSSASGSSGSRGMGSSSTTTPSSPLVAVTSSLQQPGSNSNNDPASLKSIAQEVVTQQGSDTSSALPVGSASNNISQSGLSSSGLVRETSLQQQQQQQPQQQQQQQQPHLPPPQPPQHSTTEAHIPPLLGVAPLGPVGLNKETRFQYQMLEAAFQHMPHPSDSERLRPYLPRNPCPTPPYYPQLPAPGSDSIDFFQRLSTETLFFIFYYMEGTKAQYLAAKALKKQSWRFHTKYMMWFQRHEEPKVINDEYELGTYIYFDFEKWGQRKKEGFTFEYRFLEDRDLN